MIIGVPHERKPGEKRVAITPDGVSVLRGDGHTVLIERNAGMLSGFTDEEYAKSGAEVVDTLQEVWERCELLLKVKEVAKEEFRYFRPGLAVFSFLHPAVAPEMMKAMLDHKVVGLD